MIAYISPQNNSITTYICKSTCCTNDDCRNCPRRSILYTIDSCSSTKEIVPEPTDKQHKQKYVNHVEKMRQRKNYKAIQDSHKRK